MILKKGIHSMILVGVLGLLLPLGFDLKPSLGISVGFAFVFSLLKLNTRLVQNMPENSLIHDKKPTSPLEDSVNIYTII